ncbi:MAG: prepilin-type N-terminal cleavage/methylation domain-containing protein [Candidatus Methylacidiphilales bacterium]
MTQWKAHRSDMGFTLMELMTVTALIALLLALGGAGIMNARKKADQQASISRLRIWGVGIQLHISDHSGRLPGPLWPGQVAEYDVTRPGRLVVDLADYIGLENAAGVFVVEDMLSPAFKRMIPQAQWATGRHWVVNMNVPLNSDPETSPTENVSPWGNRAVGVGQQPVPLARITQPSRTWAMTEADQLHPDVAGASWRAQAPAQPLHGNRRPTLFFDGRLEMIPVENVP